MHELDAFAEDFWAWRARTQPRSRDDIVRLTRPPLWLPELGRGALAEHRAARDGFAARLASLAGAVAAADVADRVDARLLRSAVARVGWELDVVRVWALPAAYVDAALGPVFDVLLPPGIDAARVAEVTRLLGNAPAVVAAAAEVLPGCAAAELAALAAGELTDVRARLEALVTALAGAVPDLPGAALDALAAAGRRAASALEELHALLRELSVSAAPWRSVGLEAFEVFLRDVACVPAGAQELRAIGVREYQRAVVAERLERNRWRNLPPPVPAPDAATQCAREDAAEASVRAFVQAQGLLSQPSSLRRYLNAPMPAYLEPLRFLGVTDDLTSAERPGADALAYVPQPGPDLPYFYAANAADPRAGIVHEGVHAQQLALSWQHPRPVRRHYYDSGANEGIAFYHEEMALLAGLFEDAPHTRVTMHNFMRLRALRVQVDVGLATGSLSIAEAADLLRLRVPMDAATAAEEAAFFAQTPGQAMTYQVGKTQVLALLADASVHRPELTLRELHDRLWREGNVPIALQRWELLGATDELAAIGVPA